MNVNATKIQLKPNTCQLTWYLTDLLRGMVLSTSSIDLIRKHVKVKVPREGEGEILLTRYSHRKSKLNNGELEM